jgi:hypothetical protein
MQNVKTVDDNISTVTNPLYRRQKEGVARMRSALLSCSDEENGYTVKQALQSITSLRVYHQLNRIIQYLSIMDKLEAKLYDTIDFQLDNADESQPETLMMLLGVQEKLQKSMIESHKLLQPYLDLNDFSDVEMIQTAAPQSSSTLMKTEERDSLRSAAQSALMLIMNTPQENKSQDITTEENKVVDAEPQETTPKENTPQGGEPEGGGSDG